MKKENWEKEFERQFVKDLGDNVEPVFKDPNGSVGPVKQFISSEIKKAKQIDEQICEMCGKETILKATKDKAIEELRELIEKTIEEERYSGAPHALNTLLNKLNQPK